MLARCAGPDKYYPLIDTLFAQQQKWAVKEPLPPLRAIARQAGFTEQSFDACINDKALLAKVQQNAGSGHAEVQGRGDADVLHHMAKSTRARCRSKISTRPLHR